MPSPIAKVMELLAEDSVPELFVEDLPEELLVEDSVPELFVWELLVKNSAPDLLVVSVLELLVAEYQVSSSHVGYCSSIWAFVREQVFAVVAC